MNGLAATAGAVWLKLRSDFTYRTPPDHIRTYVRPGGEIGKKKQERETGVFSFPAGAY